MHDREYNITILLNFRPLVPMSGVLDGQIVQIELFLHLRQF